MENIEEKINQILEAVRSLEDRVVLLEQERSVNPSPLSLDAGDKKVSIKEFLLEKRPKDAVQTTLSIGFYLESHEGVAPFNKVDLEEKFRAAKIPAPANINDKVNMCIKNGHMMEDKEKKNGMKAWVLTNSGEELIKKGFNNN